MKTLTIEKVVANVSRLSIYTFCNETNEKEALNRAIESYKESYDTCMNHAENYPDQFEYWNNQANEYKNVKFEVITYEEYKQKEKEYYLSMPLREITEDKFHDMLNCLPPLKWCTINGTNEFLMSEFWSGNYTDQYARKDGKFYSKLVDAYDQNTWIHNFI